MMFLFVTALFGQCFVRSAFGLSTDNNPSLLVTRVAVRQIRTGDVGLFIDVIIKNMLQCGPTSRLPNETLFVTVKSDECCMQFVGNQYLDCMLPPLIGGYMDLVFPGRQAQITLILPMLTLHGRAGHCDIEITSRRASGLDIQLFHRISFNTTGNYVSAKSNTIACTTHDLNSAKDCAPVNCEEKYFGKRNFFNNARNICEVAPSRILPQEPKNAPLTPKFGPLHSAHWFGVVNLIVMLGSLLAVYIIISIVCLITTIIFR